MSILRVSLTSHATFARVAQHNHKVFACVGTEKGKAKNFPSKCRLATLLRNFSFVSAFLSLRLYFSCCYTNRLSLLNIFSNEADVF